MSFDERLNIRIPKELKIAALKKAKNEGTNLSTIIFYALRKYANNEVEVNLAPKEYRPAPIEIEKLPDLSEEEKKVLLALKEKGMSTDELIDKVELSAQDTMVAVGRLTFKNLVKEKGFHFWILPE